MREFKSLKEIVETYYGCDGACAGCPLNETIMEVDIGAIEDNFKMNTCNMLAELEARWIHPKQKGEIKNMSKEIVCPMCGGKEFVSEKEIELQGKWGQKRHFLVLFCKICSFSMLFVRGKKTDKGVEKKRWRFSEDEVSSIFDLSKYE